MHSSTQLGSFRVDVRTLDYLSSETGIFICFAGMPVQGVSKQAPAWLEGELETRAKAKWLDLDQLRGKLEDFPGGLSSERHLPPPTLHPGRQPSAPPTRGWCCLRDRCCPGRGQGGDPVAVRAGGGLSVQLPWFGRAGAAQPSRWRQRGAAVWRS